MRPRTSSSCCPTSSWPTRASRGSRRTPSPSPSTCRRSRRGELKRRAGFRRGPRRVDGVILRVLQRLGILVVSLFASSVLVFAFMAVLPGDPARVALGVNASDQSVAQLREQFGLDRPLVVQYLDWAGGLLTFRLGNSYVSGAAIGPQVADRLQVTLWLVVTATVIATIIAIPLGVLAAVRHRKPSGLAVSAVSQVGVAVPAFLAGI